MRVRDIAKVGDFIGARLDAARVTGKTLIGGSDQREIPLERQREHEPAIAGLHDVAAIVVEQAPHHDVAALVEPRRQRRGVAQYVLREQLEPGSGRIDQDACGREIAPALHFEHEPPLGPPFRPDAARAGADHRATFGGIERADHHQPRVVRPAVGIFEPAFVALPERRTERIVGKRDGAGWRQDFPPAEMIVDEQPQAQHPRRTQTRFGRQHEAHRPDQVRRHPQHHLALDQRLAHQPKPSLLEIAQPAVNELGRGRRRAGGKVVLLDQQDAQPAAGGVAGNPRAIDAAAHNGEIEVGHSCDSLFSSASMAQSMERAQ